MMAALVLIVAAGCRRTSSAAECFDTPEWGEAGGLELRSDPGGAALLLRHRSTAERLREDYRGPAADSAPREPGVVYRYDAASARLERADPEAWSRAAGDVVDCNLAAASPTDPFVLDARERTLRWRDRPVRFSGRIALAAVAAPDGTRVAVLSADGPSRGSVSPASGRAGAAGQHYHEVFRMQDAAAEGRARPLPLSSETVALAPCWSSDGRYVIYADVLYNHLCVVDAAASGEGAR
jgi:hypothetical protein